MYRSGRAVDPDFDASEDLYQRFLPEAVLNRIILATAFRFPKQSVNRSKYGPPEWVKFSEDGRYDRYGVLSYTPGDLPDRLVSGDGRAFTFYPRHVPEEDNYSHCEIWHDPDPDRPPSGAVRKEYRIHLSQRARIRIPAPA
jgi:hypothetical protein